MATTDDGKGSCDNTTETVRQTIVETIEAPRLTDISTEDFVTFRQKREIYERQVGEKNSDATVKIPLTTYRNSIDKSILDIFVVAEWVPVTIVEEITEHHLEACIDARSRVDPADYDLAQIERELKGLKMGKANKTDTLERQVWRLCLQYNMLLNRHGYQQFIEKQPHLAVEHLLKRIDHDNLRNRMKLTIKLRKEEGFKKNFKLFVQELAKEARAIDRQDIAKRYTASLSDSDDDQDGVKPRRDRGRHFKQDKKEWRHKKDDAAPAQYDKKRKRPDCLNPMCKGKHFINECPITSDAEKKRLREAYFQAKKQRKEQHKTPRKPSQGRITRIGGKLLDSNSTLFSATFCDGAVEAVVMADQGSDINLLPSKVLTCMLEAEINLGVVQLPKPQLYDNANLTAEALSCSRKVQADCMLRIRHGNNLLMRGIEWMVSDVETEYVIIGRPTLDSLGINNRVLLSAACDRFDGVVNIPDLLVGEVIADMTPAAGSIHSILQTRAFELGGTYHSHGGAEDDKLEESDVYIDLGDDPVEALDAELASRVAQARSNGMSDAGAKELTQLIDRYKSVLDFGWESPHQPTYRL